MVNKNFDLSIIRPEMRMGDFKIRSQGIPRKSIKSIEDGLQTLHTLETMAVNIYKFQITKKASELNLHLIAAMCNEMTHLQDFQVKLFEYGLRPSKLRLLYWLLGFALGFFSRLMGRGAILKTGIWVEGKAIGHYQKLLDEIEWEEDTRKIIEKDQADESGHFNRWKALLERLKD